MRSLPMFTEVSHPCLVGTMPNVLLVPLPFISNDTIQCLANSFANVLLTLLPMSSSLSCPSSRKRVFRVFRVLMPVSCSASCPCLPTPLARYHFAPRLVITLSSRSSSLRSEARVFCGDVFRGVKKVFLGGFLKTFQRVK